MQLIENSNKDIVKINNYWFLINCNDTLNDSY